MKNLTVGVLAVAFLAVLGSQPILAQSSKVDAKQQTELDALYWNSIKDTNDLQLYEAYVSKFPEGVFVEIAQARIKQLISGDTVADSTQSSASENSDDNPSEEDEEWDRPFLKVEHNLDEHF